MPLYSYQVIDKDGKPGRMVEFMQHMNEPPLTQHPETGEKLERLMSAPNIAGQYTDRAAKKLIGDNKRLEQLGFTKYERVGKGVLERKVGNFGPPTIGNTD